MKYSILLLLILANIVVHANSLQKSKSDTIINTFNKDFIYNVNLPDRILLLSQDVGETHLESDCSLTDCQQAAFTEDSQTCLCCLPSHYQCE